MVQPKAPPLSIRPGEARLAWIDAYAKEHNLSRHLTILLMLDEGYRSLTKAEPLKVATVPRSPSTRPAVVMVQPEHVVDPGIESPGAMIAFGPTRAKFGERAKKGKT